MSEDKAIHILYESIEHLLCEQSYGECGRYLTYYAEDRLYLVFDLWYHGFYLVEASSPKDAINKVNCDQLAYIPEGAGDDDEYIKKADVLKIVNDMTEYEDDYNRCTNMINKLPPADVVERKRGEWLWHEDEDICNCSECEFEIDATGCIEPMEYVGVFHFCPNCGADNRKEEHTMEEFMYGQEMGNPEDGSM